MFVAEVDQPFPAKSRHVSEEILIEKKATFHYQLFSGVEHGFAVRGNMQDKNERRSNLLVIPEYWAAHVRCNDLGWAKEESARGIVGWWNRFLS